MPVARIREDADIEFFYRDSGVPSLTDKPYTTLVLVHGFGFNSHIFHRLLPIAAASHVRLVLLNRRGYSGSTPFSSDETDPIDPSVRDDAATISSTGTRSDRELSSHYTTFIQQRGAELARFLAWFIEYHKIPPRNDNGGRASGGISLLGWSLGNVTTLSMLAFANTFDPALTKTLESYLRKLVIYDPPHHALGYPTPKDAYNPLFDPEIPEDERQQEFAKWVSSYFSHSPSARDPATPLQGFVQNFLEQRNPDPSKEPTENNITSEDRAAGLEHVTPSRGDPFALFGHAFQVNASVRVRAIFGNLNETSAPLVLPKVDVSYIWSTESVWEAILAMRSLKEDITSPPPYHYVARPVKFFALDGGNHFAHYDDPLKAFATMAQAIE